MDKQKRMISAILIEKKVQTKGTLCISQESIVFVDNNGKEHLSHLEWNSLSYSVRGEKVSYILFIKQTRPLFHLCDNKGHELVFIADQIDFDKYSEISKLFEHYINLAKKKELEKKSAEKMCREQERKAEEQRIREEEERALQEKIQREEELKEQERLAEEARKLEELKKKQEEIKREQERVELESRRQKELEEARVQVVSMLELVKYKNECLTSQGRKNLLKVLVAVRDDRQYKEQEREQLHLRIEAERKEKERLEAEARRREEELQRIREEEARREQERLRIEAERKERERVEAEARRREEELQRIREEEARREQERLSTEIERLEREKSVEEEIELSQVPNFILEICKSSDAEIAISYGASVVFDFWIKAYNSESVYEYLTDVSNLYDEVVGFLNYCSGGRKLVRDFEKLVEDLCDDIDVELEEYEDVVSDFLLSVCENIHPHYKDENEYASEYLDFSELCKRLDNIGSGYTQEEVVQKEIISDKEEMRREKAKEYQRQCELVLAYVCKQRVPFTNYDILRSVSGTTKRVIQDVLVREEKILNFYKEYFWYDNLNISKEDELYIERKVQEMISDFDTHHISELYDTIQYDNRSLLNKYMLSTPHRLFSVVKYICRESIATDRPYIARYGVKIRNAQERLFAYISNKKAISVRNIIEYAAENYMQIGNIIQTINSMNGTHLLSDKHNLFMLRSSKITASIAKEVENLIYSEIKDKHAIGICELTCSSKLPDVGMKWNEWLIYSILNKWSSKLFVDTVGLNYRTAIPIVSTEAFLFESEKERIEARCRGMALGTALDIFDVDAVFEDALEDILADLEI